MRMDLAQFRTMLATPGPNRTTLLGAVAAVALVGVICIVGSRNQTPTPEAALTPPPAPAETVAQAPIEPTVVPPPTPLDQQAAVPVAPPAATEPPAPGIASVDQTPGGGKSVAANKPAMEIAPPKTAETKPPAVKKEKKVAKAEPEAPAPTLLPLDRQALGYTSFARDVDSISAMKLDSPTDVRTALGRLKKHEPKQMSQGWIAYGAGVAAKNGDFSKSIAKEVEKRGRDGVLTRLAAEPSYLLKIDGAYAAMNDVLALVQADTGKLNSLQQRFITTSYEFQKIKKWGALEPSVTPSTSLAALMAPPENDPRAFVVPAGLFGGGKTKAPAPEVVPLGPTTRALELAARLAMGDSTEAIAAAAPTLVTDKGMEQCLRWSRLNLNQCMAAAHFPSEEAYCTGKHAVAEVSACWTQLLPTKS